MTPEERFTRIENLLATVGKNQARHDAQVEKHNAVIEKHNAAIQDLIVISRTLLDSHKQTTAEIDKLVESIAEMREAQQATDEKLHILIETINRMIRNRNQ